VLKGLFILIKRKIAKMIAQLKHRTIQSLSRFYPDSYIPDNIMLSCGFILCNEESTLKTKGEFMR